MYFSTDKCGFLLYYNNHFRNSEPRKGRAKFEHYFKKRPKSIPKKLTSLYTQCFMLLSLKVPMMTLQNPIRATVQGIGET